MPRNKEEINSPKHYTQGRIETIDVIEDIIQFYDPVEAYMVGEIIRYLARAPHKGRMRIDLKKAQWYMNRLAGRTQ